MHHVNLRWRRLEPERRPSVPDDNLDGLVDDMRGPMAVVSVEDNLKAEEAKWVLGARVVWVWVWVARGCGSGARR